MLSIRKRASVLAAAAIFATLAIASTPAFGAAQKYTCMGTDPTTGQTYTHSGLTAAQAKKVQERYPGLVTCTADTAK